MLPTSTDIIEEVLPTIFDVKYRNLLENQITYINKNRDKFLNKVSFFYK